ncbi:MAG: helix-turn-helix transcriptional regulator [Caulobacteraceae bacterium]
MRIKLKAARESSKLTQEQVAKKLNYSKSHYCMIENGQRGISVEKAMILSKLFDKPIEELFNEDDISVSS